MFDDRNARHSAPADETSNSSNVSWPLSAPADLIGPTFPLPGRGLFPGEASSNDLPQIDGFTVRAKLAAGGMGSIYRAFDEQLKVEVALKVPQKLTAATQECFLEEARRVAAVQHRNVISVRNFGRGVGCVYFSMPLVEGPNGHALVRTFQRANAHQLAGPAILELAGIDQHTVLPELAEAAQRRDAYFRLVALWIAGAAEGLDAVHRHRLLHRDVKPVNFLMARDGRLLVADFGLAVTNEDLVGRGRELVGTWPYVAPERLSGDQATIDQRADIWALGATLYELLTYRRAYPRDGDEVLQDIATRDPDRPRALAPYVPRRLEPICLKAMRRDPNGRYQTAADMADDLRRWASSPARSWAHVGAGMLVIAGAGLAIATQLVDLPERFTPTGVVEVAGRPAPSPAAQPAVADVSITPPIGDDVAAGTPAVPELRADTVLLAFSEDLNAADDQPAEPHGLAAERMAAHLEAGAFEVAWPSPSSALLDLDEVVAAAHAHQARFVVWGELRAEPEQVVLHEEDGRTVKEVLTAAGPDWFHHAVKTAGPTERIVCHWTIRLHLRIVDALTTTVLWEKQDRAKEPRRAEMRYGGDAHARLLNGLRESVSATLAAAARE